MMVDRQWIDTVPPASSTYWFHIRQIARGQGSDGCTCAPDIHVEACYEHDIHWHTGQTIEGLDITTRQANRRLWRVMCARSPFGLQSWLARVYWCGVTIGMHFVKHRSR